MAIPAGMKQVMKDEFWAAVMSEKRNIHPTSQRDYTYWNFTGTDRRWGWSSQGFVPRYGEQEQFAIAQ